MKPLVPGPHRQSPRAIPSRLGAVVEYLELFQPKILTADALGSYLRELGIRQDPAKVAHDLQRLGWLLPLRTKGRWEFAPGARAGALPSGDPFVELRATLQRRHDLPLCWRTILPRGFRASTHANRRSTCWRPIPRSESFRRR